MILTSILIKMIINIIVLNKIIHNFLVMMIIGKQFKWKVNKILHNHVKSGLIQIIDFLNSHYLYNN